MHPILFESTTTSWATFGLGVLSSAIICEVEECRNGTYELEMQYPVTGLHFDDIQLRRLILAKPNYTDDPQPFRIYNISKPLNGIVTVNAQHLSYDLSGFIDAPFTAVGITAALAKMTNSTTIYPTSCPFTLNTDISSSANMQIYHPESVRALLGGVRGSLIDTYGGEWHFDKYNCTLHGSRGADRGVVIRYGKNLTDLKQEENNASVYTAVYPYYYNADVPVLVTLDEKVVQVSGTYNYTRVLPLDLSDEFNDAPSQNDLRTKAQQYIQNNNIGVPKVNLTIGFQELEGLNSRVDLCDQVSVYFGELGVSATAKCIRTKWDVLKGRYIEAELGSEKSSLAETIANTSEIQEAVKKGSSQLAAIAMNVASKVTGNHGGYIVLHDTNGDDEPDEILIMNTADITTATKVIRFNNGGIAFSKTGYNGTYSTAWNIDGEFVANFIASGELVTDHVKILGDTRFYWDSANITMVNPSNTNQIIRFGKYDGTHYGLGFSVDGGSTWKSGFSFSGIRVLGDSGNSGTALMDGSKFEITNSSNTSIAHIGQGTVYNSSGTAVTGYYYRLGTYKRLSSTSTADHGAYSFSAGASNAPTGIYSNAVGYDNSATGSYSNALGYTNTASGTAASALGYTNTASGASASAIGRECTAGGSYGLAGGYKSSAGGTGAVALGYTNTASSTAATALGYTCTASGNYSVAEGYNSEANKEAAVAIGHSCTSSGTAAVAMGRACTASGNYAVAEGYSNTASGVTAVALGYSNSSSGTAAATLGRGCTASGNYSLAEGYSSEANKEAAIAMGYTNTASGTAATALGRECTASGNYSLAEGYKSEATQEGAVGLGYISKANGTGAAALGRECTAGGSYSLAEGYKSNASGAYATALGYTNTASSTAATALGYTCTASGAYSLSDGYTCTASGTGAIALGCASTASGNYSISAGYSNDANKAAAISLGYSNTASGTASAALGRESIASGNYSLAEGYKSTSSGSGSVALGYTCTASGDYALSSGYNCNATNEGSIALGLTNTASGKTSITIGQESESTQESAIAMGWHCHATGDYTVSIGSANYVTDIWGTALGTYNNAGAIALAVGHENTASAASSIAIGRDCTASKAGAIAIGEYCEVTEERGIAIGSHCTAAGRYIAIGKYNTGSQTGNNYALIVGGGTSSTHKDPMIVKNNGDTTITGSLTQNSDERLKTIIGDAPDLSALRAVRYKWNENKYQHDDNDHIGYIAQDVEKVAPYLVGEDGEGYKTLDYIGLLCAKVDMLERTVEMLMARIERLEAREIEQADDNR